MINVKEHWENVFNTKKSDEVSWFQRNPKTSIDLILSTGLNKDASIIDIGGGNSRLVDKLLDIGFRNISVLDISQKALEQTKQRLGERTEKVKWIESDITQFNSNEMYDIWHDRAAFHFLTSQEDINTYVDNVKRYLRQGGYLIISTFSKNGPKRCSGLDIKQYSEESMKETFGKGFEHIKSLEESHQTPLQKNQIFIYNVFRREKGGKKYGRKIK